jgi:hypothetical protein
MEKTTVLYKPPYAILISFIIFDITFGSLPYAPHPILLLF